MCSTKNEYCIRFLKSISKQIFAVIWHFGEISWEKYRRPNKVTCLNAAFRACGGDNHLIDDENCVA